MSRLDMFRVVKWGGGREEPLVRMVHETEEIVFARGFKFRPYVFTKWRGFNSEGVEPCNSSGPGGKISRGMGGGSGKGVGGRKAAKCGVHKFGICLGTGVFHSLMRGEGVG